jgi:predicted transcriptional regulator
LNDSSRATLACEQSTSSRLAEIAERLAKEMDMPEWKCSNGFLKRFKKRHNITFKLAASEAAKKSLIKQV